MARSREVETDTRGVPMLEQVHISVLAAADPATLQQVASLCILAWGRTPTDAEVTQRADLLAKEIEGADPSQRALFIAQEGGVVVGAGRVARDQDDPSRWWLLALVVHPAHRRRGIGRALALARIAYAKQHGAAGIISQAHADNEPSIRYHEAVGFRNDGPFTACDGDQKVAFSLDISAPTAPPSCQCRRPD